MKPKYTIISDVVIRWWVNLLM